MIIILVLSVGLIHVLLTVFSFYSQMRAKKKELIKEASHIALRLSNSLTYPFWHVIDDEIENTVKLEMSYRHILAIIVRDERHNFYKGKIKDLQWRVRDFSTYRSVLSDRSFYSIQKPITKNQKAFSQKEGKVINQKKVIGYVELVLTDFFLNKELNNIIWSRVFNILLISAILITTLFFSFRKFIISPLLALKKVVDQFRKENLSARYPGNSLDEIGVLGRSFNRMAVTMEELLKKLTSTNDKLRDEIEKHEVAEKALKVSEQKYGDLYREMLDGFIRFNSRGEILEFNRAFENMFDLQKKDFSSIKLEELSPFNWEEWEHKQFKDEILEKGYSSVFEKKYSNQDGSDMIVEIRIYLNKDKKYTVNEYWAIIRDITKRKQAELEIKNFSEKLEITVEQRTLQLKKSLEDLKLAQKHLVQSEKMAALGGLVAGIAHEVNTPVGIGVTAASFLDQETKKVLKAHAEARLNDELLLDYLETAEKSSSMILSNLYRSANLIQSFKKVAVDQSSEKKRCFLVKEYFEEITLSLHPELKKGKHQVLIDCDEHLKIESYPGALSQIFTNLVLNSINHGFEDTKSGKIEIEVLKKENNIQIIYKDNGKGIKKEILSKIFDPFFTTKRGQGGSGLGLHLVFNLVSQTLKGNISCKSEIGHFTQFFIQFPLS